MFASRTTKSVDVPSGTVTIRRLSALQLEAAERELRKQAIAAMQEIKSVLTDGLGEIVIEEIQRRREAVVPVQAATESASAPEPDLNAPPPDPLTLYDQRTVLVSGCVHYQLSGMEKAAPFTPALVDDLEEDLAPMLAREILRLTKPALFQTAAEAEAAQKNG